MSSSSTHVGGKKKKMFAMHSTLFPALKQKLRLPASLLEALFMLSQERVK